MRHTLHSYALFGVVSHSTVSRARRMLRQSRAWSIDERGDSMKGMLAVPCVSAGVAMNSWTQFTLTYREAAPARPAGACLRQKFIIRR